MFPGRSKEEKALFVLLTLCLIMCTVALVYMAFFW